MSYVRRSPSVGRFLTALVLCTALISPAGQRLVSAAATWVGHLYATAVITAVNHDASQATPVVAPAHPERNPR